MTSAAPWGNDQQARFNTRLVGGKHIQTNVSNSSNNQRAGFPRPGSFQSSSGSYQTSSRVLAPPGGASSDIFGSGGGSNKPSGSNSTSPTRKRIIGGKLVGSNGPPLFAPEPPQQRNHRGLSPVNRSPLHRLSNESPFRSQEATASTASTAIQYSPGGRLPAGTPTPRLPYTQTGLVAYTQTSDEFSGRAPLPPIQSTAPRALGTLHNAQTHPHHPHPHQQQQQLQQQHPAPLYHSQAAYMQPPTQMHQLSSDQLRRRGPDDPQWLESYLQMENSLMRLSDNGFLNVPDAARMVNNYNLVHNLQMPLDGVVQTIQQSSHQGNGVSMVQVHEFCERLMASLRL